MSGTNPKQFTGHVDYWWYRARASFLENFFGKLVGNGDKVLDVGSADGPSVAFIDKRIGTSGKKTSMDIEPEGLKEDDILGSVEEIPIESEIFDIVSAFDVIEHVKDENKALDEIYRVLKPGGILMLSVPAYQWAWSKHDEKVHHYRRYTSGRLTAAVRQSGFHDVEATYAFFGTFPLFALQRTAAKLKGEFAGEAPQVSPMQEKILMALSRIDLLVLKLGLPLPWGSSVLLKAKKPLS